MKRTIFLVALLIVGVLYLLAQVADLLPSAPSAGFEVTVYILVSMVVFLDLIDVVVRLAINPRVAGSETSVRLTTGEFTPPRMRLHMQPWAILVSVHDAEDELPAFLEAMEPYRDRLWFIDDASSDRTFQLLRQAGVHCIRGEVNRKKPGAIRALLAELPPEIRTVAILDPDVTIRNGSTNGLTDLERCIFDFQRSGHAAMCPRIGVRQDGWLARLQQLEYAIIFAISRRSLRDRNITSGVAVYRRDALEHVMNRHELSVYAEDLRNALILLGHGERIYYDSRLVIDTAGKRTWSSWMSQRVGWFFGFLKVYRASLGEVRKIAGKSPFLTYHYVFYMGICAIALHPLRLVALALSFFGALNALDDLFAIGLIPNSVWTDPVYFLLAYVKYLMLALMLVLLCPRGERLQLLPAVPMFYPYQLLHIVPVTLGYLNWFTMRFFGRRLYRDHFQDEESLAREFREEFGGVA